MWDVISPPAAPATPHAPGLLNLKELSNALDSVVNWHSLGVKLGLEDHELRTIEQNYRGDGSERCKHEVLSRYLRSAKLPTWKAVVDALQQMGEQAVALKIQAKYCSSSSDTAGTYLHIFFRAENSYHVHLLSASKTTFWNRVLVHEKLMFQGILLDSSIADN